MVAPSGSTKEEMRLSTPARFSTQAIVRGRVPFDDAELKAVSRAGGKRLCIGDWITAGDKFEDEW